MTQLRFRENVASDVPIKLAIMHVQRNEIDVTIEIRER